MLMGIFLLAGAYFMGSIPFGLLLAKMGGLPDPRYQGSGNIGATNLLRLGGKKIALLTFLLDTFKGVVAVLLTMLFEPTLGPTAGIFAVLGHVFPLWLQFHGGKGIATCLGIFLVLSWPTALISAVIWGAAASITRYVSLASLSAAVVNPFLLLFLDEASLIPASLILAALIVYTHQENIQRLFSRNEPKIGEKRNGEYSSEV